MALHGRYECQMGLPQSEIKILLIGKELRASERFISTFKMISAEMLFADDAAEGLRLMTSEGPAAVICSMELPDASSCELCKAVRSHAELSRIPLIFTGDEHRGLNSAVATLHAGADDLFVEHFSSEHFLAKLVWVMEQKNIQEMRKKQFAALKAKQVQTLDIVKETAELFSALAGSEACGDRDPMNPVEQRIEFGMTMISGLAGLLEEQFRSIEDWLVPAEDDAEPRGPSHLTIPNTVNCRQL